MIAAADVIVLRVDRFSRWMPQLITAVAAIGGVDRDALIDGDRTQWLLQLRRAVIVAAREIMHKSYPLIGVALGGRDHTTIIHQHRQAIKFRALDPEFAALVGAALVAARAIAGCPARDMVAADIGAAAPR